ncbi:hypothetical protein HMPREF9544_04701 [Escherichia coli MS 153-1]|uniref:Uncharacterized protein n=2 Tax=Escherichia coli TaxID=562 RepID=Q8G9Z2_ECOLX|nr:hypothetical protein ECP_4559 [Escherichia coli 536]EFJ54068.1 hypothetical protein HMPREF9549_04529 [Escherichia coli MS 185-1]EFJ63373.1 hypothetical protein HMPREF9553_00495 [Escherichia coli MS 200-1]EFJ92535.1 hypothetical protein HMPREF9531_02382 [Escherichia coli MS 45-1]EFU50251.1 hypothetical protein HMPREF9544_04701 [Escherichia coli MS 153-1]EGB80189.1 hypothetical protein HMPREF9533_05029 [Escherichia coli MS 60-1]CAD42041.1 hypothetical protein [Escherichia coli]
MSYLSEKRQNMMFYRNVILSSQLIETYCLFYPCGHFSSHPFCSCVLSPFSLYPLHFCTYHPCTFYHARWTCCLLLHVFYPLCLLPEH